MHKSDIFAILTNEGNLETVVSSSNFTKEWVNDGFTVKRFDLYLSSLDQTEIYNLSKIIAEKIILKTCEERIAELASRIRNGKSISEYLPI